MMPAQSAILTVHGDEDLVRNLLALGREAPQIAAAALAAEAEAIVTEAKRQVPVDLGTLKGSGHVQAPAIGPSRVTVEMGFGGAAASYAVHVHEGRGPGKMPPRAKLEEWARRNGLEPGMGYVIARAIARRGIKPTKFLERPLLAAMRGMGDRLAARMRTQVERRAPR